MKKIIVKVIFSAVLVTILCGISLESSAFFGTGVSVVAENVNLIKTGLLGQKLSFSDGDFKSALCISDFDTITVTEIPSSTEGTLLLNGRRVGKGRVIKRKNLGGLVFVPSSSEITESRFKFTVEDYAGGAEIECIMKFISKVNYAPKIDEAVSSASTLTTQEAIGVYGTLGANDPENDMLEYIVVTYPKRGTLEIINIENGNFKYTPKDGFTGTDKFTYVARDEYGNYSKPATVSIKVKTRMCETVYLDMEDREEYNAAVAMTSMGIMGGKLLGDDNYFLPDEAVTRAEFVAMAMKCFGIRADSSLSSSYFDDDSDIPVSLKGYVATAQRIGLISGDFKDGKLIFSPNNEITKYEAAKILSSIIGTESEGEESVFAEDYDVPVWARAGVYAMRSLGIFSEADSATLNNNVTRADTANYLYKIMEKY